MESVEGLPDSASIDAKTRNFFFIDINIADTDDGVIHQKDSPL